MIVGLGTDIVETARIGRIIQRHGDLFLRRVFTEREIRYCGARRDAVERYSGRWAAKEAVMKTLATGMARGVGFRDVEVVNEEGGRPTVELHGRARAVAEDLGIDRVLVTISHCQSHATATAVACRPPAAAPGAAG